MFKRILVPTDGSELSDKAVAGAIALAKIHGAGLVVVNVQPPFRKLPLTDAPSPDAYSADKYLQTVRGHAAEIVARVKAQAEEAGVAVETRTTVSEQPFRAIVDVAEGDGCDLIFMASHGRRGVAGLLLGSETQKVLTHCKVPVLVFR